MHRVMPFIVQTKEIRQLQPVVIFDAKLVFPLRDLRCTMLMAGSALSLSFSTGSTHWFEQSYEVFIYY